MEHPEPMEYLDQVETLRISQALAAPIPPSQVKKRTIQGKTGTRSESYITARVAQNRLDSVLPGRWKSSLRNEGGSVICRIEVLLPMPDGSWQWVGREDGCGEAAEDADDKDEKGSLSTAFKRTAVLWGIARELYRDGMPTWAMETTSTEANDPEPSRGESARRNGTPPRNGSSEYDPFSCPKNGRGLFAWSKDMEKKFKFDVVKYLNIWAKTNGLSWQFGEWDDGAVQLGYQVAVQKITTLPSYNGEFSGALQEAQAQTAKDQKTAALENFAKIPPSPGGFIPSDEETSDLKRRLLRLAYATCRRDEPPQENPKYPDAIAMIARIEENTPGLFEKPSRNLKDCHSYDDIRKVYNAGVSNLEALKAKPATVEDDIPW